MIVAHGGKVAILDLNEDLAKATAEEIGNSSGIKLTLPMMHQLPLQSKNPR